MKNFEVDYEHQGLTVRCPPVVAKCLVDILVKVELWECITWTCSTPTVPIKGDLSYIGSLNNNVELQFDATHFSNNTFEDIIEITCSKILELLEEQMKPEKER